MTRTIRFFIGMGILCGSLFLHFLGGRRASAEPVTGARAAQNRVLLELFTSEGCSSCPPADRLLLEMAKSGQVGGAKVIALEWHVDYWNDLGWADPFSAQSYTDRQQMYARKLGAGRVYTPQMVIDGRFETLGSSESRARPLIEQAAESAKAQLELTRMGDALSIAVQDISGVAEAAVDLFLVISEEGLITAVPRGENAGRTLPHGPIARQLRKLARVDKTPFQITTPLNLLPAWRRENLSAVVFLQRESKGQVLGAAQISLKR